MPDGWAVCEHAWFLTAGGRLSQPNYLASWLHSQQLAGVTEVILYAIDASLPSWLLHYQHPLLTVRKWSPSTSFYTAQEYAHQSTFGYSTIEAVYR